jgi:hypothetical protein
MKHTFINSWYERSTVKKRRFREIYGRKPTREEIKLLRKGHIDLGGLDQVETGKFTAPYHRLR